MSFVRSFPRPRGQHLILIWYSVQGQFRAYSASAEPNLKETLRQKIPEKRELLKKVKSHASKSLGEVKVENALGGMRYKLEL